MLELCDQLLRTWQSVEARLGRFWQGLRQSNSNKWLGLRVPRKIPYLWHPLRTLSMSKESKITDGLVFVPFCADGLALWGRAAKWFDLLRLAFAEKLDIQRMVRMQRNRIHRLQKSEKCFGWDNVRYTVCKLAMAPLFYWSACQSLLLDGFRFLQHFLASAGRRSFWQFLMSINICDHISVEFSFIEWIKPIKQTKQKPTGCLPTQAQQSSPVAKPTSGNELWACGPHVKEYLGNGMPQTQIDHATEAGIWLSLSQS